MSDDLVLYETSGEIAHIRMNQPPVNALGMELIEALIAALRRAGSDPSARAVVISSTSEKVFCAGLDLGVVRGKTPVEMKGFLNKLYLELYDVQYRLGKPSVAAARGAVRAGGMTIMLSCDVIIAGEGSTFGYPEIDVGLIPALHFVHLPRIAGRYRAFDVLFTGRSFDVAEAREFGMISRIVGDDMVMDTAVDVARNMASKSPLVTRLGKDAFMRANDLDYRRGIENVAETFAVVAGTDDAQEGLTAFVEKRPPKWTGS
jgi:enoyl-CoA hydratase/carnithine racemase